MLHAGEGLPQPSGQHSAAELSEEPDLLGLQWHDPLEVRQVTWLVAAVAKRLYARLPLGQQRRQPVHAGAHQALLQRGEQRAAQPLAAPVVRQGQQDDPAAIPADTRGRRANHDLTDDRDDREALLTDDREHLGQAVNRTPAGRTRLLPDADDLVKVIVVEVPHPGHRHRLSLPRRRRGHACGRGWAYPPTLSARPQRTTAVVTVGGPQRPAFASMQACRSALGRVPLAL